MTGLLLCLVAWLAPLPQGPDEAFFESGNAAFRAGDFAEAVRFYRSALWRRPGDDRVRFNLALAEQRLGVAPSPVDRPPDWLVLVGSSFLSAAGLLVLLRRRPRGASLALGLMVVGSAGAAVVASWQRAPDEGVVLAPHVALRAEPHVDMPVTASLRAGETVRVAEGSDRWVRVEHARGAGWAPRAAIGDVR